MIRDRKLFFANILLWVYFGMIGLFAFWLFYPYKFLEIEQPVKVLTPVVEPGDPIVVSFNFEKFNDTRPEISLRLVDGIIYNLPTFKPQNTKGFTEDKAVAILVVPPNQPCGEYHIEWTATYRPNPIREEDVKYESEVFRINSGICNE